MNSIKTAVVVVILLGVLYGVYRVLNVPERPLTQDEKDLERQPEPTISPGTPLATPPLPDDTIQARLEVPELPAYSELPRNDSFELDPPSREEFEPEPEDPTIYESRDLGLEAFRQAMMDAESQVQRGRFRDALEALTIYYDAPNLSDEDRRQLTEWLDALAGKVIYSSEHLLEQPYVVRRGDTLKDIASIYNVPEQLLYNINRSQINNPNVLLQGNELKVVRGPFEAQVNISEQKLTLFLENGKYYAGHFRVEIGGNSTVPAKRQPYLVKQIVPPAHSNNPYGDWWIDLGAEAAIHPIVNVPDPRVLQSIGLNSVDIADLVTILDRDCRVYVLR